MLLSPALHIRAVESAEAESSVEASFTNLTPVTVHHHQLAAISRLITSYKPLHTRLPAKQAPLPILDLQSRCL